jgi:hypothetical protein
MTQPEPTKSLGQMRYISFEITVLKGLTANPLIDYIIRKNKWSKATFNLINWNAIGGLMGRLSAAKRVKVAKLQHNWQNTGRQKGLFLHSQGDTDEAMVAELCPMGCGEYEHSLHYLTCRLNPKPNEIVRSLTGIKKWMKKHGTEPGLISIMMRITRKIFDNCIHDLDHWVFNRDTKYKAYYEQLIREQQTIGWVEIFKGHLSNTWTKIQHLHSRLDIDTMPPNPHRTAERWTIGIVQQLIYITLNTWQIRNDHLHRERETQEKMKLRNKLHEEMHDWYDKSSHLGHSFEKYFRITLLQRKTFPTKQIQSWLETVKAQYGYAERKKSENGSTILDFFGGDGGPAIGGTG